MTKLKISVSVEVEYEPHAGFYPDGSTPEQMLAIDIENAKEDPYTFMEAVNATWSVKGEVTE